MSAHSSFCAILLVYFCMVSSYLAIVASSEAADDSYSTILAETRDKADADTAD